MSTRSKMEYKGVKICDVIRSARESRGLMQREVAEKLGVPSSTYSNWEQGIREPSIAVFLTILELCGIEVPDLFTVMPATTADVRVERLSKDIAQLGPDSLQFVEAVVQRELSRQAPITTVVSEIPFGFPRHYEIRVTVSPVMGGVTCPHCGKTMGWSEPIHDWKCPDCGYEGQLPEDPVSYFIPTRAGGVR